MANGAEGGKEKRIEMVQRKDQVKRQLQCKNCILLLDDILGSPCWPSTAAAQYLYKILI